MHLQLFTFVCEPFNTGSQTRLVIVIIQGKFITYFFFKVTVRKKEIKKAALLFPNLLYVSGLVVPGLCVSAGREATN